MKKNLFKSAFAIACVAAASVSGFISYDQHNKNVAATSMLCKENVEALSDNDSWFWSSTYIQKHYTPALEECCITEVVNGQTIRRNGVTHTCQISLNPYATCDFNDCKCYI